MEQKNKKNERVFHIHNIMRDPANRNARVLSPTPWGRSIFIGKSQIRITTNRHLPVTMGWVLSNIEELKKLVKVKKIKVTDPDGALVDIFSESFSSEPLMPKQPDRAPEENSIAKESPGPMMILSNDQSYMKESDSLSDAAGNYTKDVPDLLKELDKKPEYTPDEEPVTPRAELPASDVPTVVERKTVPPVVEKASEVTIPPGYEDVAAAATAASTVIDPKTFQVVETKSKKVFGGKAGVKAAEEKKNTDGESK